jgi:hypothetical protein
MKLEFQNNALIKLIKTVISILNNNKISNLQIYGSAPNYRILHKVVQRLSQYNFKI